MSFTQSAQVKCEYSPKGDPDHRAVSYITVKVQGDTETHVVQALQRVYPSWQNPVILEINWQS